MTFVRFMSTGAGRALRMVMGFVLVAVGLALGGPVGWAVAAFGLLPAITGAADICPICPLLGDERRSEAGCKGASCS